jgi:putative FmdB family regulatory protein
MPTYDYRCAACGHEVEVVHGIHAPGPSTCDVCGGQMRKALSTPAIHFRGGGWAKKDARAASSSKTAAASTSGKEGGTGDGGDASASTSGAGDSGSKTPTSSAEGSGGSSKGATPAGSTT